MFVYKCVCVCVLCVGLCVHTESKAKNLKRKYYYELPHTAIRWYHNFFFGGTFIISKYFRKLKAISVSP